MFVVVESDDDNVASGGVASARAGPPTINIEERDFQESANAHDDLQDPGTQGPSGSQPTGAIGRKHPRAKTGKKVKRSGKRQVKTSMTPSQLLIPVPSDRVTWVSCIFIDEGKENKTNKPKCIPLWPQYILKSDQKKAGELTEPCETYVSIGHREAWVRALFVASNLNHNAYMTHMNTHLHSLWKEGLVWGRRQHRESEQQWQDPESDAEDEEENPEPRLPLAISARLETEIAKFPLTVLNAIRPKIMKVDERTARFVTELSLIHISEPTRPY